MLDRDWDTTQKFDLNLANTILWIDYINGIILAHEVGSPLQLKGVDYLKLSYLFKIRYIPGDQG